MAAWLVDHEIWWLLPTVPLLVFPGRWNVVGLALLPLPWLCRWVGRGRLTVRTPVDWAMVLLLIMVPVTLWATALPNVTQPAVCKLLAGVAVFYSIVNWASSERRVLWSSLGLIGLGLALAVIAPVSVKWTPGKLFALSQLYERFPLLLEDPIHPNVMAGALVLIMPISLTLALPRWRWKRVSRRISPNMLSMLMGLSCLLMALVLFLTKSRGAYIAIAVTLLVIAVLRNRWFIVGLPLGLAGLALGWWRLGAQSLADLLMTTQAIGGWEGRKEVWSRALYMMQDFPYTGIGMGTFNQVANVLYPFFLAGPDADIPHAHNLFLQVGVDLGYPGLIAYLALVLLCFWMAAQVYLHLAFSDFHPPLAAGLLGSLTALVVHGLTDAVTWGTKPAVISWAVFGLTTALYRLSMDVEDRGKRIGDREMKRGEQSGEG